MITGAMVHGRKLAVFSEAEKAMPSRSAALPTPSFPPLAGRPSINSGAAAAAQKLREQTVERRRFVQFLGLGRAMPISAARSQGRKIPRVGVLWHAASEEQEREYFTVLMQAFRDLGYEDGSTAEFLHRYPAERTTMFQQFAKELVDSKVDVIVSVTIRGTTALKELNSSIPVVFVLAADPVGSHLVESLARPGA
ncbi:hypothetical protein ACVWWI_006522 [Bradyrhizobium sp. USDA 3686]|uniref:ABC transporter substrate binding protein n=1 Tax=Bradyrhizobium canariense TaxID=255045 RepID=UPI001958563E|nr:ABC transporter substrate binding protein [Bradyrhizobium canariense]MBM7487929.1 hypothetical protein [Bradyrhizobium canariense]